MKKKLRGALALVLSALMMLAPITGASASEGFPLSTDAGIAYRNEYWNKYWDSQAGEWKYSRVWQGFELFSGDILSVGDELRHSMYAGETEIRYWKGDGYESGTMKVSTFKDDVEYETITDGMWRVVNAKEVPSENYWRVNGKFDLEAVGAVESGYPKMLGNQKLYMFQGVHTQTYALAEKTEYENYNTVAEEFTPIVLSASKIKAQFKNMYPSMAMNFYEAALYEEVEYTSCTDTAGEVEKHKFLREKTPEAAVELVFPYPKGYSMESDPADIKVLHMMEEKSVLKEEIIYPYEGVSAKYTVTEGSPKFVEEKFTLKADGIHVTADTLSPFAVAYVSTEDTSAGDTPAANLPIDNLPRTGDSSMLMLWVGLMSASVVALFAARRRRA